MTYAQVTGCVWANPWRQQGRDLGGRGFAPHHDPECGGRLELTQGPAVGEGGERLLQLGRRGVGRRGHGARVFRACQSYPEKSRFVKCHNGLRGLIDPPLQPIFRA